LRIAGGVEYGCGSYAAELRAIAAGLPVSWEGEISDLIGFHASLDIFVMISDPAGCPNASLEAIAAGLPVIATDVGGAAEQVINGVTGSLVPSRDIPALSEAMIGLGRAPELCRVQGEAGRTHIAKNFSLDAMVANYRQIFLPRDRDPAI
jgi:glycosyltransferase involved in cell wall biosynthesis